MADVKDLLHEATRNVKEDRAATKTLLISLMQYMQVGDDRHKEVGIVAAKYLETLQRSNEQLVKIASLVHKNTTTLHDASITEEERDELFEMINSPVEEE